MRLKADYRISIKSKGKIHKIELIKQPLGKRYWVRYQGKKSDKMPEATLTQVINEIRKFFR